MENKYSHIAEKIEKYDSEKIKSKSLLSKKGVCRNAELLLNLNAENNVLKENINSAQQEILNTIKNSCEKRHAECIFKAFNRILQEKSTQI